MMILDMFVPAVWPVSPGFLSRHAWQIKKGVVVRSIPIGLILFCAAVGSSQATTTTLTPITSFNAGENIVSYYRYLATDCPNEAACSYNSTIATSGTVLHKHVAAVITGIRMWVADADHIGKIALRVSASSAGSPGLSNLAVSGTLNTRKAQLFSYEVTLAVIEGTIEGFLVTKTGIACNVGGCPVPFSIASAVPPGWVLVGIGLSQFDSDRTVSPLWGMVVLPVVNSIDPSNGDVKATMHCGTMTKPGATPMTLSGPCETNWVVVAAHIGVANGSPPSGPASFPLTPWTKVPASGINNPNPSSATPSMLCLPHPRPSPGFLDMLEGFFLLAGQSASGKFTPAIGLVSSVEMSTPSIGWTSPGMPQVTYGAGLTVSQVVASALPPAVAPLTYARASALVCL